MVGLGNPGPEYASTRHNVGFRIAERLVLRLSQPGHPARFEERFVGRFARVRLGASPSGDEPDPRHLEVGVLLPLTFMNRSGRAVQAALEALSGPDGLGGLDPARDLLVVYDDLDLPLGRLRLRAKGGAGGHKGLEDILSVLGTRAVPRLRFGVGRPPDGVDPVDYVLSPFSSEEREQLEEHVTAAVEASIDALRAGVDAAMSRVNRVPASV